MAYRNNTQNALDKGFERSGLVTTVTHELIPISGKNPAVTLVNLNAFRVAQLLKSEGYSGSRQ